MHLAARLSAIAEHLAKISFCFFCSKKLTNQVHIWWSCWKSKAMNSRILPFLRASVACTFKMSLVLNVSLDLGNTPFWLVLHFLYSILSLTFNPRAKFEFRIFSCSRDIRGPIIWKVGHVTYAVPNFGHFFIFVGLVLITVSLHAKFDVCNFSRSK